MTDPKGRIVHVDNVDRTPYFVFDSHRDAPVSFGVKVSATKKTYLVQRRVGSDVVKAKLGNVRDFASIESAREAAVDLAMKIKAGNGRNPNQLKRDQAATARANTLGAAFTGVLGKAVEEAGQARHPEGPGQRHPPFHGLG